MKFTKELFDLFNRDNFTYRRGDDDTKEQYTKQHQIWDLWCKLLVEHNPKLEVAGVQQWQNSGQLARYFWTRLKYKPYMSSGVCVSIHANANELTLEVGYELKNDKSNISKMEYTELCLKVLKEWAEVEQVDQDLFYIAVDTNKNRSSLKEYFSSTEKINWFANTKGINVSIGVKLDIEQATSIDSSSEHIGMIIHKLSALYERTQKPNMIYETLKVAEEIIPDQYDGSYELVKEIVSAYEEVPYEALTLEDLDAIFFMCIGTFRHGMQAKIEQIKKSHLPEEQKSRIYSLINQVTEKAHNDHYINSIGEEKHIGMFGESVGSLRASYKEGDDITAAKEFIKLCITLSEMDDDEKMFNACEKLFTKGIRGMQTGKLSKFLHCLKPYTFPIINDRQGTGTTVYEQLGIELIQAGKSSFYIQNAREIKQYRDTYFNFKNYRVIDSVKEPEGVKEDEGTSYSVESQKKNEITSDRYGKEEFLQEAYITESKYKTIVNRLAKKKNIILQGAPGVGKSFLAKKIAYSIIGTKVTQQVVMIQFHQSYSYEDFIMGYRPNDQGGFDIQEGVFYKFCQQAIHNPDKQYYFVIDEINRGNLSKIFGELMMLIEADKRGEAFSMATVYSQEPFYIPENVYLIGLMNTADRSLALMDYALRRRFSFIEIEPAFGECFNKYARRFEGTKLESVLSVIEQINKAIGADESLGKGFKIGHSYFCNLLDASDEELRDIIECEIIPLLEEYWVEEPQKVQNYREVLEEVLENE